MAVGEEVEEVLGGVDGEVVVAEDEVGDDEAVPLAVGAVDGEVVPDGGVVVGGFDGPGFGGGELAGVEEAGFEDGGGWRLCWLGGG